MSELARKIKSSPGAAPTNRPPRLNLASRPARFHQRLMEQGSGSASSVHVDVCGDVASGYLRKQRSHV
jgi:hypothetical protein